MKIDLNNRHYDALFASAPVYAKTAIVRAVQITEEGLTEGLYADRDVRYDPDHGEYVLDTWVMRFVPVPSTGGGVRTPALEDTRVVHPGEWIVTNPKAWATDRDNNYPTPDKKFRERYELTDHEGIYRAKGMARIIRNDTGEPVEIVAPWGGPQNGDAACYFCAPYNRSDPTNLAYGERYILSENDFATYDLAEKILGDDWNKQ